MARIRMDIVPEHFTGSGTVSAISLSLQAKHRPLSGMEREAREQAESSNGSFSSFRRRTRKETI